MKGNGMFFDANSSGGYCPAQLRLMGGGGSAPTPATLIEGGFHRCGRRGQRQTTKAKGRNRGDRWLLAAEVMAERGNGKREQRQRLEALFFLQPRRLAAAG